MGADRCDALNVLKGVFDGDGVWELPVIPRFSGWVPNTLVPFGNPLKRGFVKSRCGCHFFLHDWKFERVWNWPERYVGGLGGFGCVCSPDFSPYDDWPLVVQLWNVFRNRWCGAWWSSKGLRVLPTVTWSGRRSFDFAFSGLEEGSGVIISSVGLRGQYDYLDLFVEGMECLVECVKPEFVVGYGKPVEGVDFPVDWRLSFAEENLHGLEV